MSSSICFYHCHTLSLCYSHARAPHRIDNQQPSLVCVMHRTVTLIILNLYMRTVSHHAGISSLSPQQPTLFSPDISPSSVRQGCLPDCYFIAAASLLASHPQHIRSLFIQPDKYPNIGAYAVRFFIGGEWKYAIVDDRLPTADGKLAFASSSNESDFWVSILEKAFAKLYGGYSALVGGTVAESLVDLSGKDNLLLLITVMSWCSSCVCF